MNRDDRLYALVREIEANVARVEETVSTARRAETRFPIPGGAGTVVVDGAGQLLSVDLDPRALRTTRGHVLGEQVCRAIAQADAAAARDLQDRIAAAKRHISL
ncbi:YbaB/EbfC family nucleoid-associated protein [Actinophytocola sp.]|uniref:YbaB/EbfC family nucleoid-associated protein n=1 Tax=Actinophytocola sp. TaxID=1872138 RepID=UPI00389A8F23